MAFWKPILDAVRQTGRKSWQARRFVGDGARESARDWGSKRAAHYANRGRRQLRVTGRRIGAPPPIGIDYLASTYDALQIGVPLVAGRVANMAGKAISTPGMLATRSLVTGGVLYGIGSGLGDLSDEMELAGKGGSSLMGVAAFGFKAAGWRAGLRAGPRALSAAKNPNLAKIGNISLKAYESMAYKAPRAMLAGALGVTGRASKSLLTSVPVGIAKLVPNTIRGMGQVGGAFASGIRDKAQIAFGNPLIKPRGILNRLQGLDRAGGHPLLGAMGIGAAAGVLSVNPGTRSVRIPNGINPQNYGSGISYGDNRGYRSVSLGHQNVAQRMMSGGR